MNACGILAALAVCAQLPQTPTPAEREARWREDLKALRVGLSASGTAVDLQRGISSRGQKDFTKLYPPSAFAASMETLEADIPRVADGELVLGLMRLVASANVAHNSVVMPLNMGFFPRLPFTFYWYPDGLAITGAAGEYGSAIGARVVRIGNMTPDELLRETAPFISHENEVWLRSEAAGFIRARGVLEHFHLLAPDGTVILALQKPGGEVFTVKAVTVDPRTRIIPAAEARQIPVPLFRSQPGKTYWFRFLPDSHSLYIQYNSCRNDPALSFSAFARQVLKEADTQAVQRVVIDMGQNGGGDSRVIAPLKNGLAPRLRKIGRLYVLIGPATFSSAEDNALELRATLHATLVGEPAGGSPDGYGEVKTLTLPNSKLVIRYTTKHFGKDGGPAILEPDLKIPRNLADALAGRDPVLDAVVAINP